MKFTFIHIVLVFISCQVLAQKEKLNLISGNDLYQKGNYADAEVKYLESLSEKPQYFEGSFNLGDALFRQDKYEEAARQFNYIAQNAEDKSLRAKAYHNLGNSLLKAEKLVESIDAYKNSLKLNPNDEDTRYNLSYALKMQQQQQQQQQNQDQSQDQENKEDQENKDNQENKDQENNQDRDNKDNKESQDQKDNQQQNQDQQKQDDQNQQQQQPQQGDKISKEDAERMLEALQMQEKNTQDKLKKSRLKQGERIKIEKDW